MDSVWFYTTVATAGYLSLWIWSARRWRHWRARKLEFRGFVKKAEGWSRTQTTTKKSQYGGLYQEENTDWEPDDWMVLQALLFGFFWFVTLPATAIFFSVSLKPAATPGQKLAAEKHAAAEAERLETERQARVRELEEAHLSGVQDHIAQALEGQVIARREPPQEPLHRPSHYR